MVDAPGEHEANVASAGLLHDVVDDERVAGRIARDGAQHRRIVLGAGVEVGEVRLDALDLRDGEDACRDELVVGDGDERRAEEQVEERCQPVLALRRRREPQSVARRTPIDHGVKGAGRDVVGSSRMSKPKPPRNTSSFDGSQRPSA